MCLRPVGNERPLTASTPNGRNGNLPQTRPEFTLLNILPRKVTHWPKRLDSQPVYDSNPASSSELSPCSAFFWPRHAVQARPLFCHSPGFCPRFHGRLFRWRLLCLLVTHYAYTTGIQTGSAHVPTLCCATCLSLFNPRKVHSGHAREHSGHARERGIEIYENQEIRGLQTN